MWRETVNKRNHYKYFLFISIGATYVNMQQKHLLKLFLRFLILVRDEVTCFKIMLLPTLEHSVIPAVTIHGNRDLKVLNVS